MPSSVNSSHGELATLVNGRSSSPTMSTNTTLSPPSPVMRGGGKHDHSPNIISHDAMADVKSKVEKLASELKQQQQQQQQRCRQHSSNTCPILPHLNTGSITTTVKFPKRPVLSPFSRAKRYQIQQHYPSAPHPNFGSGGIPGLEPTSRSLSDLHNERSYLLHNLQTQGERATRLYQRYAHLEAKKEGLKAATSISSPSPSSVENNDSNTATGSTSTASKKKKIKKDLSLYRSRIAESTQQEQLIMLRLGEIHVELVNRGRWVMTHQQHQNQQQVVYSPMSAVVDGGQGQGYFGQQQWQQHQVQYQVPATPLSADSYSSSPVGGEGGEYLYTPSVLSPLSPSFVPGGGVSFFEDIWSRPSQSQPQGHRSAPEDTREKHLPPAPGQEHVPEQEHEQNDKEGTEAEEDDQTPKPHLPLSKGQDLEAVPLSAVTPKFTTTASTVSTLPSEDPATPITPGRIPWDEYPSDSEEDGSFDSFDGSSFTPIGVVVANPFCATKSNLGSGSGFGSGSAGSSVMVSEPEEEPEPRHEQYGAQGDVEEEEEEQDGEKSDDSASEPGDLLSEQQRRIATFSQKDGEDEGEPVVSWKGIGG